MPPILKACWRNFSSNSVCAEMTFTRQAESTALFLESAVIFAGQKSSWRVWSVCRRCWRKKYDLRDAVLLAELNLDLLLARRNPAKSFKPFARISRHPPGRGDDGARSHDALRRVTGGEADQTSDLEAVELFDVFRGKNVSRRPKEPSLRLTYRAADKS